MRNPWQRALGAVVLVLVVLLAFAPAGNTFLSLGSDLAASRAPQGSAGLLAQAPDSQQF